MLVNAMCYDDGNITKIKSRRCDVENCNDCLRRSNADEVEAAAECDYQPDSIDRSMSEVVDLAPKAMRINLVSVYCKTSIMPSAARQCC